MRSAVISMERELGDKSKHASFILEDRNKVRDALLNTENEILQLQGTIKTLAQKKDQDHDSYKFQLSSSMQKWKEKEEHAMKRQYEEHIERREQEHASELDKLKTKMANLEKELEYHGNQMKEVRSLSSRKDNVISRYTQAMSRIADAYSKQWNQLMLLKSLLSDVIADNSNAVSASRCKESVDYLGKMLVEAQQVLSDASNEKVDVYSSPVKVLASLQNNMDHVMELERLTMKITNLEKKERDLMDSLNTSKSMNNLLQKELEAKHQEIEMIEATHDKKNQKHSSSVLSLQQHLSEKDTEMANVKQYLSKQEQECASLKDLVKQMTEQLQHAFVELEKRDKALQQRDLNNKDTELMQKKAAERISILENNIAYLEKDLSNKDSQLAQADDKIKRQRAEMAQISQLCEEQQEKVKEYTEMVKQKKKLLAQLSTKIDNQRQDVRTIDETHKRELAERDERLAQVKLRYQDEINKLCNLHAGEVEETEIRIQSLRNEKEDVIQELTNVTADNTELQQRLSQLEQEKEGMEIETRDRKQLCDQYLQSIDQLQMQIVNIKEQLRVRNEEMHAFQSQIDDKSKFLQNYKEKLAEKRKGFEEKVKTLEQLYIVDRQKLEHKYDSLMKELNQVLRNSQEKDERIKQLQVKLDTCDSEKQIMEASIAKRDEEIANLQNTNEQLEDDLIEAQDKHAKMEELQETLSIRNKYIEELRQQISTQESEFGHAAEDLKGKQGLLLKKLVILEEQSLFKDKELEKKHNEIVLLKQQLDAIEKTNVEKLGLVQIENDSLKNEKSLLAQKYEEAKQKLDVATAKTQQLEMAGIKMDKESNSKIQTLSKEYAVEKTNLTTKNEYLERELQESNLKLLTLQQKFKEQVTAALDLEQQLKQREMRVDQTNKQVQSLEQQLKDSENQVTAFKSKMESGYQEHVQFADEKLKLQQELTREKSAIQLLRNEVRIKELRISQMSTEHKHVLGHFGKILLAEVQQLKTLLPSLRAQVSNYIQHTFHFAHDQIIKLDDMHHSNQAQLAQQSQFVIEGLQDQLKSLEHEMSKEVSARNVLMNAHSDLQQDYLKEQQQLQHLETKLKQAYDEPENALKTTTTQLQTFFSHINELDSQEKEAMQNFENLSLELGRMQQQLKEPDFDSEQFESET